ncbi:hypothetical protein BDV97DRAFT_200925 [Delphinella strobiligena]|nr:hypothetical protein BDV97DRAFT_200925 [Delphinella strobiligena]
MRAALQPKAFNVTTHKGACDGAVVRAVVPLDDIVQNHSMSNTEHTVNEVHEILKSYYKVARKRFADNLCMQAADFHLVNGSDSPSKLFDPLFVSRLSEDELGEIAGEDETLKRRRATLDKDIKSLEEGKKIISSCIQDPSHHCVIRQSGLRRSL